MYNYTTLCVSKWCTLGNANVGGKSHFLKHIVRIAHTQSCVHIYKNKKCFIRNMF